MCKADVSPIFPLNRQLVIPPAAGYDTGRAGNGKALACLERSHVVVAKVLISESDFRLLEYAYGDLRRHGYEVIVESTPAKALKLIRQWRPQVVVASARCLSAWEERTARGLASLFKRAAVMVTVDTEDSDMTWQRWTQRGCEVLFKPLIHSSELRAAIDQALAPRSPASVPPSGGDGAAVA